MKILYLLMTTSTAVHSLAQLDRIRGALYGLYYADAIAMPVHWMYDLRQLQADYGTITGYVKPKDKFLGSIMNLSNTGGGGRGSDAGDIVGNVILHGKKQYWVRGGNNHYHLGLEAGENTLEAQLTRLLTRVITSTPPGASIPAQFRQEYITFMTTKNTHRDTYASTCHRMFFANYVKGVPPEACPDNDGHNVDTIDALTLTVPITLKYATAPAQERHSKVCELLAVTRKSRVLDVYAVAFSDLLVKVLQGKDLKQAVEECGASFSEDGLTRSIRIIVERSRGDPMTACYIDSAFLSLLFFAYKYADSPERALLANANAGGENVARGSLLGALIGAAHGPQKFPEWMHAGLYSKEEISSEIEAFSNAIATTSV